MDGASPEGDRRDLPNAPKFAEGWSIGKPDDIFKMQKPFTVPADGTVPYDYISIPTNLKEDIWIRAAHAGRPLALARLPGILDAVRSSH